MNKGGSLIFLAVVLLLGIGSKSAAAQPDALRVMSFNIRYDEPRDGVNAWSKHKQKVAVVIRFHKANLVGVQEALLPQLRDLENLLPGFAWVGVGRTDGKEAGEYSAILYRKGRFQVIASNTFWLSETPARVGSKGWDGVAADSHLGEV